MILLTSTFLHVAAVPSPSHTRILEAVVGPLLENCAYYVEKRPFTIWIIDDAGTCDSSKVKMMSTMAQSLSSRGLKHPFTVLFTERSKVQELLNILLENPKKSEE